MKLRRKARGGWLKRLIRWSLLFLLASALLLLGMVLLLRSGPVETSSIILQEQFSRLFDRSAPAVRQEWVGRDQISRQMALAAIAAEDQRFPDHFGLDFKELEKAAFDDNGKRRGASTITQQVAKNLFFWGGRSYLRKGLEAVTALLIESLWSKERILEVYLNIAQFGDGIYGVKVASAVYYRKSPSSLTASESALMAAVLPNPVLYSVRNPSPYTRRRQAWILRQMNQLGGTSYLNRLRD